ncbi:hypothetical protein DMR35_26750 [Klebsiella variicola]|nr:hypothetical protein DMR35_26750 [Klebsiella variicola]
MFRARDADECLNLPQNAKPRTSGKWKQITSLTVFCKEPSNGKDADYLCHQVQWLNSRRENTCFIKANIPDKMIGKTKLRITMN